jgi:amino acid adenylation domain-containing protein
MSDERSFAAEGQGETPLPFDPEQSLPACFRAQASIHGSRCAIGTGDWRPTFAELDAVSNRLANRLIATGVTPGDRVAILMRHDGPQIAALLGALKAGAIIVVLNRTDPPARLNEIIAGTEPKQVVTDSDSAELAAQVWPGADGLVPFDPCIADGPSEARMVEVSPHATAFLMYTSGSSGRPKIVMQTHRLVLHNALRHSLTQRLRPEDRIALLATLSGAQGMGTAWSALANAATLFLYPTMERGVADLACWLNEHAITIYVSASSVHRHFMGTLTEEVKFPSVRLVMITSEWATANDFHVYQRHFPPPCEFIHGLGSSETGNVTRLRLRHGDVVENGRLPIGQPSEGIDVAIVDETNQPVRRGEIGEMIVRSRYLAGGYWRDEKLTRERFSYQDGLTTYRGGDLARVNAQGQLEFLGRKDAAIKIGGFFVDPSAVEEALLGLPGVERAAVLPWGRPNGEQRLAAYLQLRERQMTSEDAIRRALRQRLPRHMVPATIQIPDIIPLTPQGKIDREQLRQYRPVGPQKDPPATETEALVAKAWAEAFQSEFIARQDNFFDLGGDSLVAAVIGARLHESFGLVIDIDSVFDHPLLSDLAQHIDSLRTDVCEDAEVPPPRVSRDAPFPLSFGQEFYWRTSQSSTHSALHVTANWCRIFGPLRPDLLRECINVLAQRHEILRTSFPSGISPPVQIVHPAVSVPLSFHDYSGDPQASDNARRLVGELLQQPFEISQPPLVRFALVRIRDDEHWLLKAHHHIILDGWSWNIFFRELGRLYQDRLEGLRDSKLDAARQYGDYAIWQRDTFGRNRPHYQRELLWWIDHLLANAYPDRVEYRRRLLWCIRAAPHLPRPIKRSIGSLLRRFFRVRRPHQYELPFRREQRVHDLDPREGTIKLSFAADTSQRLSIIERQERASHFAVRLAGFAAVMAAELGIPRIAIGSYFSTRNRGIARDLFGFCANHAVLVLPCDLTSSFRNFLLLVRDHLRAVQPHGELPYELLAEELDAWGVKLPHIQSHVSVATPHADLEFDSLRLTFSDEFALRAMPPGFGLQFGKEHGDECFAAFDAHSYRPEAVRAFLNTVSRFLDIVSRHPDISLNEAVATANRRG